MKRLVLALILWTTQLQAEDLKLAVTTSFENAGLADVLLPAITRDTGLNVQLLVVGTGQALRLGAAGDVDAILVHARVAEDAFIADGHATHRRPIMYNDFVLVGPRDDPAAIATAPNVMQAFDQIAVRQSPFVSRGDDSGTHQTELALWRAADHDPEAFGQWYHATGAGMGAALNTASGLNAYILTDRASWLTFGNPGDLTLLFAGDPALFNQYAYLPIDPTRHSHINASGAATLEAWLTSETARGLIDGYRLNGARLFTFNAD